MALTLLAVVGAVLAGLATGGRVRRLGELPMRHGWVVAVAAALQLAGALVEGWYAAGLVASFSLAAVFLWLNRSLPGLPLVALGLLSNALVVAANGAMPVSLHALDRSGLSVALLHDARHELADAETRLRPLSDVIPLPLPVGSSVISAGDVLIASGVQLLVFSGMRQRRSGRHAASATMGATLT